MNDIASRELGEPLSIGRLATLVCLWEVMAAKPGNVHRGADFEDLTFADFVMSAWAIGPVFDRIATAGVGRTVREAIAETRRWVGSNTNLGMVLALAPLAAAAERMGLPSTGGKIASQEPIGRSQAFRKALRQTLSELTEEDSREVYEAIRLAVPGGLGEVNEHDVRGDAPQSLLVAMGLAADRDRIASLYVTEFCDVFDVALPLLVNLLKERCSQASLRDAKIHELLDVIVALHVELLARWPDSLIARKSGMALAEKASDLAKQANESDIRFSSAWWDAIGDLDFWLRADGHRRNPGTTADLVCATLFAAALIDPLG